MPHACVHTRRLASRVRATSCPKTACRRSTQCSPTSMTSSPRPTLRASASPWLKVWRYHRWRCCNSTHAASFLARSGCRRCVLRRHAVRCGQAGGRHGARTSGAVWRGADARPWGARACLWGVVCDVLVCARAPVWLWQHAKGDASGPGIPTSEDGVLTIACAGSVWSSYRHFQTALADVLAPALARCARKHRTRLSRHLQLTLGRTAPVFVERSSCTCAAAAPSAPPMLRPRYVCRVPSAHAGRGITCDAVFAESGGAVARGP